MGHREITPLAEPSPPPGRRQSIDQLLHQATAYLPVALMAMLALATYWLVHNTPMVSTSTPNHPVRHIADYTLQDFTINTYAPAGRLLHQLSGHSAHHFPDTNTLEIDQVQIKSYPSASSVTQASAQKALTNRDGSDVRLMGHAVVENTDTSSAKPPVVLQGESLEILSNQQRLQSDLPVVLKQGQNQFSGDNLNYDHLNSVVTLQGRVHGVIQPAPLKKAP